MIKAEDIEQVDEEASREAAEEYRDAKSLRAAYRLSPTSSDLSDLLKKTSREVQPGLRMDHILEFE